MSTESTEAVFAALAFANVPAHSWSAQTFTDHQQEAGAVSVTGYHHSMTNQGVASLAFTVNQGNHTIEVTGKFKKGSVNEVDIAGAAQALPTFQGPVDAGTGEFDANSVKTQIWLRYEEASHLKEYRFETSINFPHPLPLL